VKHAKLNEMVKGWFVGAFNPTACSTNACEVAVKHYSAGDKEEAHYHKVATEVTLILSGRVRMAGKEWGEGDIVVVEPGEATDFEALTDVTNVVVKTPGALNDKFFYVEGETDAAVKLF
jgi:mannose-6-phosphate isomerase-like protein (cupin superfamily)